MQFTDQKVGNTIGWRNAHGLRSRGPHASQHPGLTQGFPMRTAVEGNGHDSLAEKLEKTLSMDLATTRVPASAT